MSVAQIAGVPRVRPIVELGIGMDWTAGGTGGIWDTSDWDDATSTWQGLYPSFVDVTCEVIDVSTFRGRERSMDLFEVGTATITVRNADGWADYPGTITPPGVLDVRPGIAVRVAAALDGDPGDGETLWFGYIDATSPGFVAGEGDVVVCDCIDAKGEVGRVALGELADPGVGGSETVTARIGRILNAASWPGQLRALDTSPVTLVATRLGAATVDLVNLAAQSAGGDIFGNAEGEVTFRAAGWQDWTSDVELDGTIGPYPTPDYVTLVEAPAGSGLYEPTPLSYVEDPAGSGLWMLTDTGADLLEGPRGLFAPVWIGPPTVCPSMWELSNARADFATRVLVGRADMDPPLQFDDAAGQSLYGVETFELLDLETESEANLTTLGERLLETRGVGAAPRIAAVTIDAATADNTVDVIAFADPYLPSRYFCRHVTGDVERFNRTMMVTSVEHTITPDSWICRIGLDDALPWLIDAFPGEWDSGLWDEAVWAPWG